MPWTGTIEDRWDGRHGSVRFLIRLLALGALGYALATSGAFSGPRWVAVGTVVALVCCLVLVLLRALRPFGRPALVLIVIIMVLGIALNPSIDFLGSIFFVVGGIMLVGQPELSLRFSLGLAVLLSLGLVTRAVLAQPEWTVLLANLFGGAAVLLLGVNRRQQVLRRRADARSAELEQRSRIASDLHDVLAHSLGGLVVQLDAASAELEHGRVEDAAARVRTSRQLAVDGLVGARAAVEQLRSGVTRVPASSSVEVVSELRTVLCGPVGLQLGADLEVLGQSRPVAAPVAQVLVAAARESLTNINEHASGGPVSATVVFAPQLVRLEVVNALPVGSGDGPSELAYTGGGLGLVGLRERVQAVGGRLHAGPEGRRWVLAVECPTERAGPTPAGTPLADGEVIG